MIVLSSSCIMTSSELLSSMTSCMLFTLLLWLPVLTDMLGMEWLLPRLSISLFRLVPCSLSCKNGALRLEKTSVCVKHTQFCSVKLLFCQSAKTNFLCTGSTTPPPFSYISYLLPMPSPGAILDMGHKAPNAAIPGLSPVIHTIILSCCYSVSKIKPGL